MMRSRRHRARGPFQWVAYHPFLTAAILAGLSLAALWAGIGDELIMSATWLVLGAGFHLAGMLLDGLLPDLTGWVEPALVGVVGLIPYLLLDRLWLRIKPE
jgi:hypothetical protein